MIVGTDLLNFDSLLTTGVHWQTLSDMIAKLANCQQNTRFLLKSPQFYLNQ